MVVIDPTLSAGRPVITGTGLATEVVAEILVKYHSRIQKFVAREKAPFIAGINRSGTILHYEI